MIISFLGSETPLTVCIDYPCPLFLSELQIADEDNCDDGEKKIKKK